MPLALDEALELSEIGEAEKRACRKEALEAAGRVARSFPYLQADKRRDLTGYLDELAIEFERHHPDVVKFVTEDRDERIQANCGEFAPSPSTVREALSVAASKRFAFVNTARTALALHIARSIEGFAGLLTEEERRSYEAALSLSKGVRLLALVNEVRGRA